jgi:diguanylate cyclase (GGDEF)-like protein
VRLGKGKVSDVLPGSGGIGNSTGFSADFVLHRRLVILRLCTILAFTIWYCFKEPPWRWVLLAVGLVGLSVYIYHLWRSARSGEFSRQSWLIVMDMSVVYLLIYLSSGARGPVYLLAVLVFFLHWPFAAATAKVACLAALTFGYTLIAENPLSIDFLFRVGGLLVAAIASLYSGQWLSEAAELKRRDKEQRARLERQYGHLKLLIQIGRSLSANTDMERLFETMYKAVSRVMPTDVFFVALYDEREQMVELKYLYENGKRYPSQVLALNEGPTSQAIITGQPVVWHEKSTSIPGVTRIGAVEPEAPVTQSLVVVPMKLEDRVVGAVSAQSYSAHAFTQEYVQLLETVASQAAVVLSNVRLFEKTRELSLTDSMTGLANARRFYQELEQILQEADRSGRKVSLLMIDSDSLKYINDRFGHPTGDLHLITLAGIIRSHIRSHDLAARYAGDEFLVVLPNCHRDAACQIAERIRKAVIEHYREQEPQSLSVTVSIGVAMYPDDATTPEQLFRVADQAMYQSKQQGRNRVSVSEICS